MRPPQLAASLLDHPTKVAYFAFANGLFRPAPENLGLVAFDVPQISVAPFVLKGRSFLREVSNFAQISVCHER
jgi:hypothetical protein